MFVKIRKQRKMTLILSFQKPSHQLIKQTKAKQKQTDDQKTITLQRIEKFEVKLTQLSY